MKRMQKYRCKTEATGQLQTDFRWAVEGQTMRNIA